MAAIGVGGLGCLVGITSYWCILLAVIGLALGIIGMKSVRRDLAATGLVLSVLALFLGFTQIGVDIKAKIESRQILESYDAYDEAQGF